MIWNLIRYIYIFCQSYQYFDLKSARQKSSSSFFKGLFMGFSRLFVSFPFSLLGGAIYFAGWGNLCIFCSFSYIFSSHKSSFPKNLFRTPLISVILSSATFICRYLFSKFYFFSVISANSFSYYLISSSVFMFSSSRILRSWANSFSLFSCWFNFALLLLSSHLIY